MSQTDHSRSELHYRNLFERAPVAIWDEDFSGVRAYVDSLGNPPPDRLRALLEGDARVVGEAISRVKVRHVNRLAREFYGAESETELISALPRLFDPASTQVFVDEIVALASGASCFSAELATSTLRQERRLVQMNVSLLPTPRNDWSRVVVTFTDLTERRRLEQSLQRANDRLQQVNADLEQFAYAAAHDLREPLRTISMYAQILQESWQGRGRVPQETAVSFILGSAERLRTLIDDMLQFARMTDPGDLSAKPPINADVVAREVLESLAGAITASGSSVEVLSPLPHIPMKVEHFRQLLQNLLANAIKYRHPERSCKVSISAGREPGAFVFRVSDNGIGIPPEHAATIFGLFRRLNSEREEGNGIGLSLCRKVIEQYGGRIWVESQPGIGSDFCFAVPTSTELP